MNKRDYLIMLVGSVAVVLLGFFLMSYFYGQYLEYQDYGFRYFYPIIGDLISVIILGTIACAAGKKSVVFYYLQGQQIEWGEFKLTTELWLGWQVLKIGVAGFLLKNTIFGLTLISLLMGYSIPAGMGLILFGPVLNAVLVRIIFSMAGMLPEIRKYPSMIKIVMVLSLLLGILFLRSASTIIGIKILLSLLVFVTGGAMLVMKKENLLPLLGISLLGVLVLTTLYDVFVGYQVTDKTLWYAGLGNMNITELEDLPPSEENITLIEEGAKKVPLFDSKTVYGLIPTTGMDVHEKLVEPELWFNESSREEFWVVAQLLAKSEMVAKDWLSMHITYTSSEGIFEVGPVGGEVHENSRFPKKTFYYGQDAGFDNWVFIGAEKTAGVLKSSPAIALFDYRLPDYLPGRLVRNREVTQRVGKLFPYLSIGEPYLVTDGTNNFYVMGLIAELPTTWESGVDVSFLREVGKAAVNVETGEIILYKSDQDEIANLLEKFYTFQQLPKWLEEQNKYPTELLKKQLKAVEKFAPAKLAPWGLLKPRHLLLSEGPQLIMLLRPLVRGNNLGYLDFGCGKNYGKLKMYLFKEKILLSDDVSEKIRASAANVPNEGLDLGSYVKTNRPKMGDPIFCPLEEEYFYFVPIYVKEDSKTKLRYVVALNTRNSRVGVGETITAAVRMTYGS